MAKGFPGGSDGEESACNVADLGLIPGLGRFPEEGNGNPLQDSCLENLQTEEPGGLQCMGWQRVRDNSARAHTDTQRHTHRHRHTHTDTHTHRHTDTDTHTHTHTHKAAATGSDTTLSKSLY